VKQKHILHTLLQSAIVTIWVTIVTLVILWVLGYDQRGNNVESVPMDNNDGQIVTMDGDEWVWVR